MSDDRLASGPQLRLPARHHLDEPLAALEGCKRQDCVEGIKRLLRDEWEAIRTFQVQYINEITGLDIAGSLTAAADAFVRHLAMRACRRDDAPSNPWQHFGVFALGGYGRAELAPSSDLDMLLLWTGRGPIPDWLRAAGQELQTLLWDCGFHLAASMRGIRELEQILQHDFVTATAVLEQRPLLGEVAVTDQLVSVLTRFRRRSQQRFLRYKVEELQERRDQAGASLFRLEPDVKHNPGCMRDIQFLRNTAYMLFGSRNLHALRELDSISWQDVQRLFAGNDHLVGVRAMLHFHHQKRQDQLRLTDQLWLADLLGYAKGGRLHAVEHMMRLHYEKTLHVHQMVELVVSRLRALGHLGRRRLLIKTRRKLNEDFAIVDGKVYLSRNDFWQRPDAARRIMDTARQAQRRRVRISFELQRTIQEEVPRLITREVRADHQIARSFLAILGDLGRVAPILQDLHHAGFLGAWLPEFGNLTCHMQFDSYNQYTVDEHTLMTIGHLDDVLRGRSDGIAHLKHVLYSAARIDMLVLGLLLHDIGKFMGSGHVRRGALMVHTISERLGLEEEEEDLLHFLVEKHVRLSDATRFRDIHDPAFLRELADEMGSRERLDLLYCLTWADGRAVGEGVITGWQEAILVELYEAVADILDGEQDRQRLPPRRARIVEALQEDGRDPAEIAAHLQRLPRAYAYQAQPTEAVRHFHLIARAEAEGLACSHEEGDGNPMLTCVVPDRLDQMARVAAAITGDGCDVVDARAWRVHEGWALFHFRLQRSVPTGKNDDERISRLEREVAAVVRGELEPDRLIERRRSVLVTDPPADSAFNAIEVRIEQENLQHATIVDVRVKDLVGLLHLLCRCIAEQGCEIQYASIVTYGDVARDAFYVTRDGAKLPMPVAAGLRNALLEMLQREVAEREAHKPATGSFTY